MNGGENIKVVAVLLLLLSVGLIVGPVGVVIAMNSSDLSQLIFPAKVKELINGGQNYLLNTDCSNSSNQTVSVLNGLILPKIVNVTINQTARTFIVVVNVTNNFSPNLELNNFTATAQANSDHSTLLEVKLKQPAVIVYNETSPVTLTGYWTVTVEQYTSKHSGNATIGIELANVFIEVNHISIKFAGPVNVGNIPITWVG